MSRFTTAGKPEIIRSAQKDDYYSSVINNYIDSIFGGVFGLSSLSKWKRELQTFSELLYFAATTLAGYQTLGEEYVSVVQVEGSKLKIPSRTRRLCMILLQTLGPYISVKGLQYLQRKVMKDTKMPLSKRHFLAMQLLPNLEKLLTVLHRSHMAYFYLTGIFYHLSKRFTNTRYILLRRFLANNTFSTQYTIMGILSLCQLLFSSKDLLIDIMRDTRDYIKSCKEDLTMDALSVVNDVEQNVLSSRNKQCVLCLQPLKDPTATKCGHIFCWYCVHTWCQTKHECPVCRGPISPSRLVYLHYYRV